MFSKITLRLYAPIYSTGTFQTGTTRLLDNRVYKYLQCRERYKIENGIDAKLITVKQTLHVVYMY